jgi:uncharacterized coiled-coil protein SlyX
MRLDKPFPTLRLLALMIAFAALSGELPCDATLEPNQQAGQQQSQSEPPQSPPVPDPPGSAAPQPKDSGDLLGPLPIKRRRVWTNDDMTSLRTPADNYQAEKEAKAAAAAAAAAKEAAIRSAAKSDKKPSSGDFPMPGTIEETQKMIKDTSDDVQELTTVLDKMRQELAAAPEAAQADKQKEIDRLTAALVETRRKLKALQDHLQVLTSKGEAENPPGSPPSL